MHSATPHHLIIDSSNILVKDGHVLLLLCGAHLDCLLITSDRLFVLLLLEEVVTLLLYGTCSLQGTLIDLISICM